MSWMEQKEDGIILNIRVVPRASTDGIVGVMGTEALKVRIQAPPVDGKANAYLVRYLSKLWKIPRINIEMLSGETGRNKRIRIRNPSGDLIKKLSAFDTA